MINHFFCICNIIAITSDGVYNGNNQILKGNFPISVMDIKDNYMIISDISDPDVTILDIS